MTQPQAVSEPTNQNDGNLPEIDKVLESSDNWLEYEPKTELGKVFYKWSQSNLPRHMPIEDWNRPWAVAHTQAFEQLLSQALTNARKEGENNVKNTVFSIVKPGIVSTTMNHQQQIIELTKNEIFLELEKALNQEAQSSEEKVI